MKLLMMLFLTCSLLGCAGLKRPDANIYGINVPAKRLRGYNLKRDYDDDGTRKPDAKPIEAPLTDLRQLNGWYVTDPVSLKNIKASAADVRDYIKNGCK